MPTCGIQDARPVANACISTDLANQPSEFLYEETMIASHTFPLVDPLHQRPFLVLGSRLNPWTESWYLEGSAGDS